MSFFEPDNLADACGGRWLRRPARSTPLAGVGTDTREHLDERLFVAIRGERHDGHDHVRAAAERGARAVLVHEMPPDLLPEHVGVLLVDDTRAALGRLAAAYRPTLDRTTVISVTGSCGKTTVKQMLAHVLSSVLPGRAAPRSFNNDIGLPLAILAAEPDDAWLVLELGTNTPGEIAQLAGIAQPDVGVITMVGRAHLEGFGSIEAVAREKASMLAHLARGGCSVVNADTPELRACLPPDVPAYLFGLAADADLQLTARGPGWLTAGGQRFLIGLPGRHNAVNALAAIAVGRQFGLDDAAISDALATCPPVDMRMSRHEVRDVLVINDAYNANPDSMTASLDSFGDLAADARRRVVVLGDMLELGPAAAEHHREIGERVVDLDRRAPLHHVVLVGDLAEHIAEPIVRHRRPTLLSRFRTLDRTSLNSIASSLEPGDAVLLKGSRAMGLERLLETLAESGCPAA